MKKAIIATIILSSALLSSCSWSFKMVDGDQVFESTVSIIPVVETEK